MRKTQRKIEANHDLAHVSKNSASLATSSRVWAKIGCLSFGGPAAQIALIHHEIVIKRNWLTEQQFTNALSFCMLLPGPEAMQLATYSGWRLHGLRGGLLAGGLFILPGAMVMLGLAIGYVYFGSVGWVVSLLTGLKAGISVIVLLALTKMAVRVLTHPMDWLVAIAGFVGIFFANVPFPLIIATAALYGFHTSHTFNDPTPVVTLPDTRVSCIRLTLWLALWWIPILALDFILGNNQLAAIGYFFSKLAMVTFGGAYAVLAYVAQDVVGHLGWLRPSEMMDGLGLAESTPGPLILVTEFVGFLTAFHAGGMAYGLAGAAVALWATFIPCFLWIFVGAPYVEWLTNQPRLHGALAAIMASVVGVIANLFLWFVLHILFSDLTIEKYGPFSLLVPDATTANLTVIAVAAICGALVFWRRASLFMILATSSALGVMLGG